MYVLSNSGYWTTKTGVIKYTVYMSCGCEHTLTLSPEIGRSEFKIIDRHNRNGEFLLFPAPKNLKIKTVESKHFK